MPEIYSEDPEICSHMELLYNVPETFKKILKTFKSHKCDDIVIRFEKEDVYMSAVDHYRKSAIFVHLIGEQMNTYYCKEPFSVGISQSTCDIIINSIGKNYTYVKMRSTVAEKENLIAISTKNGNNGELREDVIELAPINEYLHDKLLNLLQRSRFYKIHFEIEHGDWKNDVNNWLSKGTSIQVGKYGNSPILFSGKHNKGYHKSEFVEDELIKLRCELEDDERFMATINLQFIKAYSTTPMGKTIEINIDDGAPIVFTSRLDFRDEEDIIKKERCVVNIITCTEGIDSITDALEL